MPSHEYWVDLRISDIDGFGHVHYAQYLTLSAEARARWLADTGMHRPGDHVVARVEVDYLSSAHLPDGRVRVGVAPQRLGTSSLTLREEMSAPDGRRLVDITVVIVRFDLEAATAVPWSTSDRTFLGGPMAKPEAE